ncbi:hypothetical protein DICPUDRAFT_50285 [Dictyostelium purpureum]|uniref:Rho-GAP domain-containing protein n=1 Tax=Dictyostelium purpureum TaxID=5786 RepID=F0ZXU0_DICPU|nr:uncharacterized protein DICPUDRAFT_50285 [Dictyostelium purpureum]EGC31237.1 hypothetical protein DICPUDRAFT_50285 [Dictyostelium purpureum]|eukprot:XP_003292240.1 hypothetical protein DICPUDRAFT_50285 [Dictyostelium purpureum]
MNIKSLRKKNIQNLDQEEVYGKIKENVSHMDEIQKNLEKQQQTFFQMAQQSKQISESMKKYSMDSAYYNSRIPISDCLQKASEWQSTVGEVFNHLGNLLYDRTTQPLKETIRIQLEMVKDGKKRLKNLSTESRSSTNLKKDTENYDRACKETVQLYNDSELALENSTVQTVLSSFESYIDFFSKGSFQMAKIKTDIDNYKKVILETNKAAAKLRNYVPKKTFGVKLEEVFGREGNRVLPLFLDEIFKYLEKESIKVEGIFRVPAGRSSVEAFQQKIESGVPLELSSTVISDPHVVSSVLKLFLRSLPEPIIHHSIYSKYLPLSKQPVTQHIVELKRLVSSLPVCNQTLLKNVLNICSVVNQHKDVTKMDLNNLSVVIGPSILESIPNLKAEDLQKPETFAEFNALFSLMVENCTNIFPQTSVPSDLNTIGRARAQTEVSASKLSSPTSPTSPAINKPFSESPLKPTSTLNSSDFVIVEKSPTQLSENHSTNTGGTSSNLPSSPSQPASTNNSGAGVGGTGNATPLSSQSTPPSSSNNKRSNNKSNFKLDDYLTPIDMQIYYTNISCNLGRLKSNVDEIESVNEGIELIKIFKKISDEHTTSIKNLLNYSFVRDKPAVGNDEDRVTRIKKTLLYTYDITMDLISEANKTFESSSIEEPTDISKKLEESFKQLDEFLIVELAQKEKDIEKIKEKEKERNNSINSDKQDTSSNNSGGDSPLNTSLGQLTH